jgi:hypothetical protein
VLVIACAKLILASAHGVAPGWDRKEQAILTVPFVVKNDRVWRQACFQAALVRSMALSVTTSLRMQAVRASLAGFPARRSRL